ncbi:putative MFS transporter [Bacillus sp. TS-2]|nr:putative MFS transporter [Bacillus sp. TS-2]
MYVHLLKNNRNTRYYLLATSISSLGNVMTGMALLFMAYELTGSNLYTTGVAISQVLPYLLFGLVGGVIADWIPKLRWMIIFDLLRFPLLLILVCLYQFELLVYSHLIIISACIHLIGCFYNPAHRALIPFITNEQERVIMNSLLDTVTRGITVLGPIFSVVFIQTIGVIHFFSMDALTFLFSALLLTRLSLKEETKQKQERSLKGIFIAIFEFLKWSYSHRIIRPLLCITAIIVFFHTWVWQVGLLLLLNQNTSNGEEWYSFSLGVFGFVVILVNILIPFIIKKLTIGIYMIGSMIWGIGILVIGVIPEVPFVLVGIVLAAMGLPVSGLARIFLLQKYVPEAMLGRGFSVNAVILYFSNILSLALFGFLSSYLTIETLFVVCGSAMVIFCMLYLFNEFRKKVGVIP